MRFALCVLCEVIECGNLPMIAVVCRYLPRFMLADHIREIPLVGRMHRAVRRLAYSASA